jgi:omega-6 fatty acid desaturase (delta-12 desaturase)
MPAGTATQHLPWSAGLVQDLVSPPLEAVAPGNPRREIILGELRALSDALVSANLSPELKKPARHWQKSLAPFAVPCAWRATFETVVTASIFFALMTATIWGLAHGLWWILALTPLTAAAVVRLFIIQHDCGHGSFFPWAWANHWLGRCIGVVTLTPYAYWRRSHATHHATSGNLDRRGSGDIDTLTVREYRALSPLKRLWYRCYRHPLVLLGIGPIYQYAVAYRAPFVRSQRDLRTWISTQGTNAAIAVVIAGLCLIVGPGPFLLAYLPAALVAGSLGIWLFYVQHQFAEAYWRPEQQWDFQEAAVQGSSFYDLPRLLHWVTGNIGFHHIHHLSSRIPSYNLPKCHKAVPELHAGRRLGLRESFSCYRLMLWDEDVSRLVSLKQARAALV